MTADDSAEILMALLGEDGAMAALEAAEAGSEVPDAYKQLGKKEIRARVSKLAAEKPEALARIITYWLKEERNKGR
jgi:flagellar biosynthesis/type III secretory pathway M-ring protein FliF/YscJ